MRTFLFPEPDDDPSVEGVTFEDEVVLEDDNDIDGDRTRRLHPVAPTSIL